jgi:hypothetical protein
MTALSHAVFHQEVFGEEIDRSLEHPAYSPDLTPCDFLLFLTMKNHLKVPRLKQRKGFGRLRRPFYTTRRRMTSESGSKFGNKAGINV